MKTAVEFKIQNCKDRENMVLAFANSGYFVAIEEREQQFGIDYWVIVGKGNNKVMRRIDSEGNITKFLEEEG